MAKVLAAITTSLDGYSTAPDDGPGKGLGEGGERLHEWVFGGPWRYEDESRGEPEGEDAAWLADLQGRIGAVIAGRRTYEAARHWGGKSPGGVPFFILTHRPQEQPDDGDFRFIAGLEASVEQALAAAEGRDVHIMGGAEVIGQALRARLIDELTIIIAPLLLGAGKRLFEEPGVALELEQLGVRQSRFASFLRYAPARV
jgi:dihydrofolate reductase